MGIEGGRQSVCRRGQCESYACVCVCVWGRQQGKARQGKVLAGVALATAAAEAEAATATTRVDDFH